jgi:hypothetical protein
LVFKESKTKDDFDKLQILFKKAASSDYIFTLGNIRKVLDCFEAEILIIKFYKRLSVDELLDYILLNFIRIPDVGGGIEKDRFSYLSSLIKDLNVSNEEGVRSQLMEFTKKYMNLVDK